MLLQLATVYAIMNIARHAIKNKQKKSNKKLPLIVIRPAIILHII